MDYINIHQVPGRVPGETGLDIKSTKKLREEADLEMAKAKYLNSKRGMMVETIKGMPRTARKMSKAMLEYIKKRR